MPRPRPNTEAARRARSIAQLGLCALVTLGCERSPALVRASPPAESASAATRSASSTPPAADSPRLAPLGGVGWIEHLELSDGHEAYVTPPLGAREPRPLIVAVHGAGDRAEWSCGGWRMAASEYAFVACPQGLKMDAQRFAWDGEETIRKRVALTIAAARARFGDYIADGPTLYVGFSQGATLARSTLLDPKQTFPAIALAEGGYSLLRDAGFVARLKRHGASRLLLVCGTPACFVTMRAAAPSLREHGLEVLISGDPRAGHNLNGEMQAALQRIWPEFVAGLPNWRGFFGR